MISRSKPAANVEEAPPREAGRSRKEKKLPDLESFLEKRDYVGALTLLEVSEADSSTRDTRRTATMK